jgi:hypothetical protein
MKEIIFDNNEVKSLGSTECEEDEVLGSSPHISLSPEDGRCECCGRHISELEPFGKGKDESGFETEGRYLVKTWRPLGVYDDEAETAIEEAFQSYAEDGYEDWWAWMIGKHGKEKAEFLFELSDAYHTIDGEWVCRDCINLDQETYYDKRYETRYGQS